MGQSYICAKGDQKYRGRALSDSVKLRLRNIGKRYLVRGPGGVKNEIEVLRDINFEIIENQFISVIGASGCGKTTLLRIVAGLTQAETGTVEIGNRVVNKPGRDCSVVFQSINLFLWRNVLQNVELGLEIRGEPPEKRRQEAMRFIELVGLKNYVHAYPHELSGGMQQRVGIARALATNPDILLMDEPFGSLDAQTAEFLWEELLKIVAATRKTVLFVTHHIDESIYLSDRIIVIGDRPGRIIDVIDVNFRKPRWEYDVRAEPQFAELRARLRKNLFGNSRDAAAGPEVLPGS